MGWVTLAVIGAVACGALWFSGVARGLWAFVGAALMLGAAGYALQGRPVLAAHPVKADAAPVAIDPGMVAFRSAIFGGDDPALIDADTKIRTGDSDAAVAALRAAIEARPDDAALWTGLGTAIAIHDGGIVSPSALFAFRHAVKLAPNQPGPPFFLGLAYINAGEIAAARPAWDYALAVTPANAPYRADIAERVMLVRQFMAMAERQAGAN